MGLIKSNINPNLRKGSLSYSLNEALWRCVEKLNDPDAARFHINGASESFVERIHELESRKLIENTSINHHKGARNVEPTYTISGDLTDKGIEYINGNICS